MEKRAKEAEPIIKALDSGLEQVYFNGFSISVGNSDVIMTLMRNGNPILVLNASYTVSKSFAQKMGQLVNYLESAIESKIFTTDDVANALSKKGKEKVKEKKK